MSLTKILYDNEKFSSQRECAICCAEFDQTSQITPLPCNIKHYFHTQCIEIWFKTN